MPKKVINIFKTTGEILSKMVARMPDKEEIKDIEIKNDAVTFSWRQHKISVEKSGFVTEWKRGGYLVTDLALVVRQLLIQS